MSMLLLLIPLVFLLVTLFGHAVHWALHQTWTGPLHTAHMTHHEKLYPPTDFYSETYRSAGKESTVWIFAAASVPMLALPVIAHVFGLIGFLDAAVVIAEMLLLGWLHDLVHDAFHVTTHWLRNNFVTNFFIKKLIPLHFEHHVDMTKNFGIFFFLWDKLFKTLKS